MIIPVILCGGSGTRLWPLSRRNVPKQYLPLVNEKTMFQNTLERLKGVEEIGPPVQKHFCWAERWVVVKGTAKITRGNENIILTEDQFTYIPLGTQHRLENPGKIPLELIEVQTGSYLG